MNVQNQKLRTIIDAHNAPLGNTPTGRDWCIKALHPSDPLTEVRGIPDHSAHPSVLQNYQMTYRFTCDPGAVGTWGFESVILPNPVQFAVIKVTDSVGSRYLYPLNSQLSGATVLTKTNDFIGQAQRWRLAYMGATAYLDAPALSNQGSIVAAQVPLEYYYTSRTGKIRTGGITYSACGLRVGVTTAEDVPDFTKTQSMPNAYFGRAEHGAYIPLKLTETCQDWVGAKDMFLPADDGVDKTTLPGGAGNGEYIFIGTTGSAGGWPLYTTACAGTQWGATYTDSDNLLGDAVTPLLNGVVAHLCAQNISVSGSFTIFFRVGIEMQVVPGSNMASHQKLAPPYDQAALDAYYAISRELKDAYPVEYNDLGKIWDVISSIAKTVAPMIPVVGPAIGLASNIGDAVKGAIVASRRRGLPAAVEGRGNTTSLADVELAKTMVPKTGTTVRTSKKKKKLGRRKTK